MVAKVRENIESSGLSGSIAVEEGNASCMPFADDFFDTVVSTGSSHHWKDLSSSAGSNAALERNQCPTTPTAGNPTARKR